MWGGSPNDPIYRSLKIELERNGYKVEILRMPHPDTPIIKEWVETLRKNVPYLDEDIYFVGHSVGCQTIMRYLETQNAIKIGGIVFLAPWFNLKGLENEESARIADPWIKTPIDLEKFKRSTKNITAIFSDDDKFVPLSQEKIFKVRVTPNTLIVHNKGHFTEEDGITSLPEVVSALRRFK